jgi:hypothetical protein
MAPATELRTYYSRAANLIVNVSNGQRVMDEGGTSKIVGQKVAEFTPIGDGFGRLVTDDPETMQKIEARMGAGGDVFNAAEYARRTTPVDVQNKMLADQLATANREIEDRNRLIAKLQADGKLAEAKK